MTWKKRTGGTEISSLTWKVRTARSEKQCQSPICQQGTHNTAQVHVIHRGDRYAANDPWYKSYCLDCFVQWAPSAAVRRNGLEPDRVLG